MRYYFDVNTAKGQAMDREGTEYYSRDDMQSGAVRLLLEIARMEAAGDSCDLSLNVRDATGRTVSTVTLQMCMHWSGLH